MAKARSAEAVVAPDSLEAWLSRIEALHPASIALGLERVAAVASRLRPALPPVPTVTVGGTNGKGTTASLIAHALTSAGIRTGLYTSPHLWRYNERVCVDGQPASDAALIEAFAAVDAARGDIPLTYFEFGTLAALWHFASAGVEARVLEVGLGGRLDAVNLVDADIAVISSIGLDHTDWLGGTIEAIAAEKAGILRRGRPAVFGQPAVPDSLRRHAAALAVPLEVHGRDFDFRDQGRHWSWHRGDAHWSALPRGGGTAWLSNAACAAAALRHWPGLDAEAALRAAIPLARLPGRCERRGRFLLDVSHNAEAAEALAEELRAAPRPRVAVLGMLADKPVSAYVRALAGLVDEFMLVGLQTPRALSLPALEARVAEAGVAGRACASIGEAIAAAGERAGPQGTVLICGSFHTVSEAGPWLS